MRERDKQGDITAPSGGDDFPDWDNPEDVHEDWEDAPEGYYDDEELYDDDDGDSYVPGPDDPDYDLSEAAGYAGWAPGRREILPGWLIAVVSILVILSLIVPAFVLLR